MTINGNDVTIGEALLSATKYLSENKSILSPRLDSEILLSFILSCSRIDLVLKSKSVLKKTHRASFDALIKRRYQNEPIGYLTNQKEFMSLDFFVKPGILIPRPETELLVEYVIDACKTHSAPKILDLCTGSGVIAISIAHYLKYASVTAVDKYDTCLKVAQKNVSMYHVTERVNLVLADVFDLLPFDGQFDCIVSNPPYIEESVLSSLPDDVKNYEPKYALDGGKDGLCFYRRITELAIEHLSSGGHLVFEIGFNQGVAVSEIIQNTNQFSDIEIKKDYAGLDRMVTALKRG